MAGHSKWANIQHRKGRQDAARSKLFSKLSKEITVAAKMGEEYTDELMEEMTALQENLDAGDVWGEDSRIEMAMEALRYPPDDWSVTNLSGGEKRRVALARLLLSKPAMLPK